MRVTGDGWEVSPADVEALKARFGIAAPPLRAPTFDPLVQAFEYRRGERTTLASPEVVNAAVDEILRLRDELQASLVREAATRRQLASVLAGERREVAASGRGR